MPALLPGVGCVLGGIHVEVAGMDHGVLIEAIEEAGVAADCCQLRIT